ncbi:hypothetical protein KM043_003158 [Ampulex compressa]|nr:hypothetical protein KM043_003158 [Ampulex compressa]
MIERNFEPQAGSFETHRALLEDEAQDRWQVSLVGLFNGGNHPTSSSLVPSEAPGLQGRDSDQRHLLVPNRTELRIERTRRTSSTFRSDSFAIELILDVRD